MASAAGSSKAREAPAAVPPLQAPLRESDGGTPRDNESISPGGGLHGGRAAGGMSASLSWHHLVGVTFFAVCGGDYGLEDSVGAAGPALTLFGLLILPWVWSLPIALMTAELGAMIPEAGGYVVWINRAFGPFAAHMNALWNLVSNTFDNALYPVMFVDYLRYFPAMRLEGWARWLASVTMLGSVTTLNLLGVDVVAGASNLFAVLVIAPFAALFVAGLPAVEPSNWFEGFTTQPVRWGTFLSVLLWNTSGYDSVGSLAAEVHDPGRDFPLAMVVTIALVTLVYILPLAVAIGIDSDARDDEWEEWTDGHFARIATDHVGDWLSAWITLGGALSAVGLLNTLLCTSARVAVSAARLRVLPGWLGKLRESGTPAAATLAISALLAVACALPFAQLVAISMLFYGITTLTEFCALLKLRKREPLTPRPFRIPLGQTALTLACLPPMLLCVLLIVLAPPEAWVLFGATTVVGVASYLHRTGWRKVQAASGYSDISLTTLAVHVQPATMSAVAEVGQHDNTASLNSSDQGETPPHSPPDSPLLDEEGRL